MHSRQKLLLLSGASTAIALLAATTFGHAQDSRPASQAAKLAIEAGVPLGFDEVHRRIADYLELQVRQRELQHYLETLQEQYGVRGLAEIEALAAGKT